MSSHSHPSGVEILNGHLFGAEQPCFGCGPNHPTGFHLEFQRKSIVHDELGNVEAVECEFLPGQNHQGPPGIMHGGLVMTLADETAAWACIALLGRFGFTIGFEGKLKKAVRIDRSVLCKAFVKRDLKRVVEVQVFIDQNEERCMDASFRFAVMDKAGAERLLESQLPESWDQFCR